MLPVIGIPVKVHDSKNEILLGCGCVLNNACSQFLKPPLSDLRPLQVNFLVGRVQRAQKGINNQNSLLHRERLCLILIMAVIAIGKSPWPKDSGNFFRRMPG